MMHAAEAPTLVTVIVLFVSRRSAVVRLSPRPTVTVGLVGNNGLPNLTVSKTRN